MLQLHSTRYLFGSTMVFVAAIANAWAAEDALDGWDKYKFGMTIKQVQAVTGIAWGETETEEVKSGDTVIAKFTFLKATEPVKIGTSAYNLRIDFEPDIGLTRIGFENKMPVKSIAACEHKFTDALRELERRHGALATNSKVGKTDTPFGTLDQTWRNAPTGSSKYDYLIATMQFEPKGPVHRSIELNAIRKFGNKWVALRAISPNDKTRCEVTIGYIDASSF